MLKNVWFLLNDQVDVYLRATYCTSVLLDSRVTKGGESFLDMLVRKLVSLPIIAMYFITTLTSDKTTAAFPRDETALL